MIGILSNINLDSVRKKVNKTVKCVEAYGYGTIIEELLNPTSPINTNSVETIFVVVDLRELLFAKEDFLQCITDFFADLEAAIKPSIRYCISEAEYYMPIDSDYKHTSKAKKAVAYWNKILETMLNTYDNITIFPYHDIISEMGRKEFYSTKTWYLGGIRYSLSGTKAIVEQIIRQVATYESTPKKVLLLDLDNTLWGGVIGEVGINGIELSDSNIGKTYKEFQEAILEMKTTGVLLCIVSKNNEQDVLDVFIENHQMLLKKEDFICIKINWKNKSENIETISKELNLSLDSFVFIDDNPIEREEVKVRLPDVIVPDFPNFAEDMLSFISEINNKYFRKISVTVEDRNKLEQYKERKKILQLEETAHNYDEFLEQLKIVITKKNTIEHLERVAQLLKKTNQFHTTLKRYTYKELVQMIEGEDWNIFVFEIEDKFTNHGICAVAIVHIEEKYACIDNFLMSCRVMGRKIEFGIIKYIIDVLSDRGIELISADYRYGEKNQPVEYLFEQAGFDKIEEAINTKTYRNKDLLYYGEKFVGDIRE